MINEWDKVHMATALNYASMSKCAAKKVACILVKDKAIISIGINGTAPGAENCCDRFEKKDGTWYRKSSTDILVGTTYDYKQNLGRSVIFEDTSKREYLQEVTICEDQREHFEWSQANEIHAEDNALGKAARNGFSTEGATAYVTHSPCRACAKALASHGIKRILYLEEFDNIAEVEGFLNGYGIQIERMELEKVE